jgi:hypothetical protein
LFVLILLLSLFALTACSGEFPFIAEATAVPTLAPPTRTKTPRAPDTATPTLTLIPTIRPTVTRTSTPIQIPTLAPTVTPFVPPTIFSLPTPVMMGLIQTCNGLLAKRQPGLFILQVEAVPGLAWDTSPHNFRVSVCNTNPSPNPMSGQFRVFISFPGSDRGHSESTPVQAQLNAGFNDVTVGPWVPGLENHITACAMRPTAQIEVRYEGSPLVWFDGKSSINLPIQCGGSFS